MSNRSVKNVKFWYWLVERMPTPLVYFCFMHVLAHSTTGKYGTTIASELSGMDAIQRYSDDNGL